VRFFDGTRLVGTDTSAPAGIYSAVWRAGTAAKGRHTLRAVVTDARGRRAEQRDAVRVCR